MTTQSTAYSRCVECTQFRLASSLVGGKCRCCQHPHLEVYTSASTRLVVQRQWWRRFA